MRTFLIMLILMLGSLPAVAGQHHHWTVAGVNYDEAFRNALRGAAKVLSGNGEP